MRGGGGRGGGGRCTHPLSRQPGPEVAGAGHVSHCELQRLTSPCHTPKPLPPPPASRSTAQREHRVPDQVGYSREPRMGFLFSGCVRAYRGPGT